jgi:phosphonatase-like hydrolase
MSIKLAVFDMAGTTVEDRGVVNRSFRETLADHGLLVEPEVVDAVMGLPKPEAFRILVGGSIRAETLVGRLDTMHRQFVERMIRFYSEDPEVGEVAGASRLFQSLRARGVKVALDTGFSRDIADAILERLGWASAAVVDATVTSDEVARGRPYPDMIQSLMSRLALDDPKTVAKIGDSPADLEQGFAAGCRWVIGVTWGTHSRAQLARYPYTHLVDSIGDLERLFESDRAPIG